MRTALALTAALLCGAAPGVQAQTASGNAAEATDSAIESIPAAPPQDAAEIANEIADQTAKPGSAPPWGEPHLTSLPRTAKEAARVGRVTAPAEDFAKPEQFEPMSGGAATTKAALTRDVFSQSSANMPFERELDFKVGNGLFRRLWATAPSSTRASDGLGPLFNARACQNCHLKDGRGRPTIAPGEETTMFLRVSIPEAESELAQELLERLGAAPEPNYGLQLQDRSIAGIPAEGRMKVDYEEFEVALAGGEAVKLRRPSYSFESLGYGPLHEAATLSPRLTPPMIGLGLVEAIPEAAILALADPEDADGDGISGKANRVWSLQYGQWMLGRFGWKAGEPTIREQSAAAFSGDIGLSTPLRPEGWGECTAAQTDCRAAPHGGSDAEGGLEITEVMLDSVTFYSRNLAVPARRDVDDPAVLRGKAQFYAAGCPACHQPKFVTHRLKDQPEQSFQLIWPYSDFLLHDMGEGLADGRSEFAASGREWRTAPLWGIGLTRIVLEDEFYLHDGRARSLSEAILWHGGEAEPAKERFRQLPPADRADLIRFLESL